MWKFTRGATDKRQNKQALLHNSHLNYVYSKFLIFGLICSISNKREEAGIPDGKAVKTTTRGSCHQTMIRHIHWYHHQGLF